MENFDLVKLIENVACELLENYRSRQATLVENRILEEGGQVWPTCAIHINSVLGCLRYGKDYFWAHHTCFSYDMTTGKVGFRLGASFLFWKKCQHHFLPKK